MSANPIDLLLLTLPKLPLPMALRIWKWSKLTATKGRREILLFGFPISVIEIRKTRIIRATHNKPRGDITRLTRTPLCHPCLSSSHVNRRYCRHIFTVSFIDRRWWHLMRCKRYLSVSVVGLLEEFLSFFYTSSSIYFQRKLNIK